MKRAGLVFLTMVFWTFAAVPALSGPAALPEKLARLEQRIRDYTVDPNYRDDVLGLHVVRAALVSAKQGSGGIGACLVDTVTGKVVETGRNRQYDPYFRSDLHAEMDLLNRYEDRVRKTRSRDADSDPRECSGLVLLSSMEPCPMCLTRIINAGIKTVLYVETDEQGGMATRIRNLPPFWQEFARDREFRMADCSPYLRKIAHDLFHLSKRNFAKNRKKWFK
ncbi:MAG: deaminase [Desulfobacter sp.]